MHMVYFLYSGGITLCGMYGEQSLLFPITQCKGVLSRGFFTTFRTAQALCSVLNMLKSLTRGIS